MANIRERWGEKSWFPWLIFASISLGIMMVNIDGSILTVALPTLQETFDSDTQTLQWVLSSYLLVVTGLLPTIGKLADLRGRKHIFIIGVAVFSIGSALCALAGSIGQLILFRVLQAIGGSMIMGNAMPIITETFEQGRRGRALGGISSVIAASTIIGPALGGLIISELGWRWIFWVNVPIGVLSILATFMLMTNKRKSGAAQQRFDRVGAVTFFVAMTSLLLFVSNGTKWGWTSAESFACIGVTLVTWAWFIRWEMKRPAPLINLAFFKKADFTVGNIANYVSFLLSMVPAVLLPLFMSDQLGMPVHEIGLYMIPQAIAIIVVSPLSGWLSDRYGTTWPTLIGMGVSGAGLALMGQFGAGTTGLDIVLAQVVFGAGIGLFQSPSNLSILESVSPDKVGVVGGIMSTVRNFGKVSGVAFAVSLYQFAGESFALYIGSAVGLLTMLLLASRLRGRNRSVNKSLDL